MSKDANDGKRAQASAALKRMVPQLRETIELYPSHVSHLLNDIVPHAAGEVFALASALHVPRFRSAVAAGLQIDEAMRLRQSMIRELGFSEITASWVAESWMEAFDIRSKEPAEFKFNCPNCSQEFIAARYWRNQKLICPACNSHVQFDESLVPRLHRKGWAQKRHKGGDWNLVGVSGKSRATLIRERLQTLLADPTLDEAAIARELGLDEIVNAIPDQVEKSLANRGKHLTDKQRTSIVKAVVKTHLGNDTFDMQSILRPNNGTSTFGSTVRIASFSWTNHHGTSVTLAFTSHELTYEVGNSTVSVPYAKFGKRWIVNADSKTMLRIGSDLTVDFSGSGTPRTKWREIFVMLSEIFREIENAS